jgi:Flp pilus assembly pilin Flp
MMMMMVVFRLQMKLQSLVGSEEGQDLVEYALLCSLLAFGWVLGVKNVASALNSAFQGVSSTLGSYVS